MTQKFNINQQVYFYYVNNSKQFLLKFGKITEIILDTNNKIKYKISIPYWNSYDTGDRLGYNSQYIRESQIAETIEELKKLLTFYILAQIETIKTDERIIEKYLDDKNKKSKIDDN